MESCLRRIFHDLVGLDFRWIYLDRQAFMVFGVATGPYRRFLIRAMIYFVDQRLLVYNDDFSTADTTSSRVSKVCSVDSKA